MTIKKKKKKKVTVGKVLIIILKEYRNIFFTFVRETTPLYKVSRHIQFSNIGKSVYFLIYFSVNIFHYPAVVLLGTLGYLETTVGIFSNYRSYPELYRVTLNCPLYKLMILLNMSLTEKYFS